MWRLRQTWLPLVCNWFCFNLNQPMQFACMYMYPRENCTTHVHIHLIEALMKRYSSSGCSRPTDIGSVCQLLSKRSFRNAALSRFFMDECIKKILIVNTGSDTFDYCQKSNLPADAGYVISALSATVGSIYHI